MPITATPYDGKFGEKKTLNYINITNSGTGITKDTTPPRVTLIGSSIVTVYSGSTYVDSGAIWSDNVDGSGTSLTGSYGNTGSFQSTGSVNTSLTGSYTIKYLKIDATGNSGSVSRTVNVVGSDDHNILQADISGTGTVGIPGDT